MWRDVTSFAAQVEKLMGIPKEKREVTSAAYPEGAASLAKLEERLSTASIRLHNYALDDGV